MPVAKLTRTLKSMHVWLKCRKQRVYTYTCISRKELDLCHYFQDCYCCSNSDVMCHVTMYCSMIGPHYSNSAGGHIVHCTLLKACLACKTATDIPPPTLLLSHYVNTHCVILHSPR